MLTGDPPSALADSSHSMASGITTDPSAVSSPSDPPYPSIDGTSSGGCSAPKSYGGSCTIALSPRPANGHDLIVVAVAVCTGRVVPGDVAVQGGGLSWTSRATFMVTDTSDFRSACIWNAFSSNLNLWEYEFYATSPSTTPFAGTVSVHVTIVYDGSAVALAFGIAGANLLAPFEAGAPVTAKGVGGEIGASLTTHIAHDMVIGLVTDNGPSVGPGGTYSSIAPLATQGRAGIFGEYRVFASEYVGSVRVTATGPQGLAQVWGLIADAVVPSPASSAVVGMSPALGPVGTQVTVTGSGFAGSTRYRYCFEGTPGSSPCTGAAGSDYFTLTTDSSGYISTAPTLSVTAADRTVLVVSTDSDSGTPVARSTFGVTTPSVRIVSPLDTSGRAFGPPGTGIRLAVSGLAPNTVYSVWFDSVRGSHSPPSQQAVSKPSGGNPPEWYVTAPSTGLPNGPYFMDIYQASAGTFITSVIIAGAGTFQLSGVAGSITPSGGPSDTRVQIVLSGTFAPNAGYVVCFNSAGTAQVGCPASLANFGTNNSGVSDRGSLVFQVPGVEPGQYYVTIAQVVGYGQVPAVVAVATPSFVVSAPSASAVTMPVGTTMAFHRTAPGADAATLLGWLGPAGGTAGWRVLQAAAQKEAWL